MKKAIVLIIAVILVLGTVATMAKGDGPGNVVGTKHNLSNPSVNTTKTSNVNVIEVCVFCHTPHKAQQSPVYTGAQIIPLWNHQTTTIASYNIYSSTTMDATVGQPSGGSKACLSCHDGTVAIGSLINVYLTTTGVTTTLAMVGNVNAGGQLTGSALLSTDLSNDHPVSFTFNTALSLSDPGLRDPATAAIPANQPISGTVAAAMLIGGTNVDCGSCHAVHGLPATFVPTAPDTTASFTPLMKVSRYQSKLCTTCHIK